MRRKSQAVEFLRQIFRSRLVILGLLLIAAAGAAQSSASTMQVRSTYTTTTLERFSEVTYLQEYQPTKTETNTFRTPVYTVTGSLGGRPTCPYGGSYYARICKKETIVSSMAKTAPGVKGVLEFETGTVDELKEGISQFLVQDTL